MTTPTLDELITIAVKMEAEGKSTDDVFSAMMEAYPDVDLEELETKLAQERFTRRLFVTKL